MDSSEETELVSVQADQSPVCLPNTRLLPSLRLTLVLFSSLLVCFAQFTGKTTLMRSIAAYEFPNFPVHLRVYANKPAQHTQLYRSPAFTPFLTLLFFRFLIAQRYHVEQEISGDDRSVIETVLSADMERALLLEEERKLLKSLKAEEVAAAKSQAAEKEAKLKAEREAAREARRKRAAEEEADSVRRLGASVDQMLDSLRKLDEEIDALDDGSDLPDDVPAGGNSTTEAEDDDDDDDEENARLDAEIAAAERAAQSDDEEEEEDDSASSSKAKKGGSKSKRGKVNRSAREAAKRKEREVTLPEATIVDPATRLTQIYARMNEIDAWGAEGRARAILNGLQFSAAKQQSKTRELSGG